MGEFDLSLISEFRSRPSFYDRNSPRFRDKLHNAREWQEISNKLGFDVSILKDRILQLRNRYNLEKRRIEQLKEENPNKYYESPWPLYDHLHFLSDHIRARRSYRKLIPLNGAAERYVVHDPSAVGGPDLSNSGSNNSNGNLHNSIEGGGGVEGPSNQNVTTFPNGLLAVKMEDDSEETEAETESQNNDSEVNVYDPPTAIHSSPMPQLQQREQPHYNHRNRHHSSNQQYNQRNEQQQQLDMQRHKQQQQQQQHPTISIRRLDTLRSEYTNTTSSTPINNSSNRNRKRSHQAMAVSSNLNQSTSFRQSNDDNDESSFTAIAASQSKRFKGREFKYTAFGNFISSSLIDLPASIALELVEKFTSDVVKALMEKAEQQEQR